MVGGLSLGEEKLRCTAYVGKMCAHDLLHFRVCLMTDSADMQKISDLALDDLVGCHECDMLLRKPELATGDRAECPRCGFVLYSHNHQIIRRSLALVIAALLLYVPANFLPIMQINVLGQSSEDTIWSGVLSLYNSGGLLKSIALVVFLCSMVIPLIKLLIQFFVLLSIRLDVGRSFGLLLYRTYHHLKEWGMLEVYLMGILVSIVKLIDIASPTLDFGLACFVALLLVQVWLEVTMEPHQIWTALSGEESYARH
jgi:paraquat-inducible protein A